MGASWGRLKSLGGRFGGLLGASWGAPNVVITRSRFMMTLGGRLGSLGGASWGPRKGLLGRLGGVLEASWGAPTSS